MLVFHQVVFTLYLLVTISYYIIYGWDRDKNGVGNAVFIMWGVAMIMSAIS